VLVIRRVDVIPSNDDSAPFEATQGLWVGVTGNVAVLQRGVRVTIVGVQAGTLLPDSVTWVYAAGTTASSIQRCYAV
jgi:hypothetical protein